MTPATCLHVKTADAVSCGEPCAATAGIVGGSGYAGALLAELLLRHPSVRLTHVSSEALAGEPLRRHLPRLRAGLDFCSTAAVRGVDVAFVCAPHGEAAPVAKRLLDDGARVIDLSADFRLGAEAYAEWYGEHPYPEMLPGVYGLTELHREAIAEARLVANPGCYPTAALLALAPLKQLGLADVVIDAKSGVSGAGKTPRGATQFCSVDSDLVAYGVQTHRHYPEIAAGIAGEAPGASAFGAAPGSATVSPSLTFVPHLVPLQRGISETIYVRPRHAPSAERRAPAGPVTRTFYAEEAFVEVCDSPPRLKDVVGTNYCCLFPHVDSARRAHRPGQRHRQPHEGRLAGRPCRT